MTAFKRGNSRASKLSVSEVMEIRRAYAQERMSQGALARKYQVSVITIGRIVRGETWQGLPTPEPQMSEGELKDSADRLMALQEGGRPNPSALRGTEIATIIYDEEAPGLGKLVETAEEHGKGDAMVEELRGPLNE